MSYVSLQFLFGFCNWAAVRYTLTPSWAPCCLLSSCCFQVSCLFYWFASSWVVCSSGLLPGDLSVLQACFQVSCLFFMPASSWVVCSFFFVTLWAGLGSILSHELFSSYRNLCFLLMWWSLSMSFQWWSLIWWSFSGLFSVLEILSPVFWPLLKNCSVSCHFFSPIPGPFGLLKVYINMRIWVTVIILRDEVAIKSQLSFTLEPWW